MLYVLPDAARDRSKLWRRELLLPLGGLALTALALSRAHRLGSNARNGVTLCGNHLLTRQYSVFRLRVEQSLVASVAVQLLVLPGMDTLSLIQ